MTKRRKDVKHLGYSQLRNMWKANFQNVVIPKVDIAGPQKGLAKNK